MCVALTLVARGGSLHHHQRTFIAVTVAFTVLSLTIAASAASSRERAREYRDILKPRITVKFATGLMPVLSP